MPKVTINKKNLVKKLATQLKFFITIMAGKKIQITKKLMRNNLRTYANVQKIT